MNNTVKNMLSASGITVLTNLLFLVVPEWVASKLRSKLGVERPGSIMQYGSLSVNLFTNRGPIDSLIWTSYRNTDTTLLFTCENITIHHLPIID